MIRFHGRADHYDLFSIDNRLQNHPHGTCHWTDDREDIFFNQFPDSLICLLGILLVITHDQFYLTASNPPGLVFLLNGKNHTITAGNAKISNPSSQPSDKTDFKWWFITA